MFDKTGQKTSLRTFLNFSSKKLRFFCRAALQNLHISQKHLEHDRRKILFLYVPRFQRQVLKHVKILSERSKETKEQKKNKGSVLVAESS